MKIHTIPLHIESLLGGTLGMDATEFGAYISLIIACYQSADHTLPDDNKRLARMARCSQKTWARIEPTVMAKFTKSGTSWSVLRIQKEIVNMQARSTKNKANALKRWNNGDANASNPQCERNAIQDTIYNIQDTEYNNINNNYISKHKSILNNKRSIEKKSVARPLGVPENVWNDWLALRKSKKATVTQTALDRMASEAAQAGIQLSEAMAECCARGWIGFKAEWFNNNNGGRNARNINSGGKQSGLYQFFKEANGGIDPFGKPD